MVDFSLTIFGKTLTDLSYTDVSDFFNNEYGESNNVEYKAFSPTYGNFNSNLKGIIRAICGLLNSDGGIVIWGAPLGVVDPITREKKFIGALSPVPDFKEKDWIINKISDNITPLPIGIRVAVLSQASNENLYVFEVQPSPYKPHQFENTYLVRLDGQTKPAPHYFVEALFRRITYPNIEAYIKFNSAGVIQNPSRYYVNLTIFLFNFSSLQNEEDIIYRLMVVPGKIQSRMESSDPYNLTGEESLLHFGTPIMSNQIVFLSPQELTNNNFQLHLVLTIAGKKSPAKSSDYTLNFSNINLSNPNDTSNLIMSEENNVLFFERQEQLGTTKERTLFVALGRNPS